MWLSALFLLVPILLASNRLAAGITALAAFSVQVLWGWFLVRKPQQHQGGFLLYAAYWTAVLTLSWLSLPLWIFRSHSVGLLLVYAAMTGAVGILAPPAVSLERQTVRGRGRRWYSWGSWLSPIVIGAGGAGTFMNRVLEATVAPSTHAAVGGAVGLILAVMLIFASWYNLVKYHRYRRVANSRTVRKMSCG